MVSRLLYLPFLMALGIGLTVTNTRAVLEALLEKSPSSRVLRNITSSPSRTKCAPTIIAAAWAGFRG